MSLNLKTAFSRSRGLWLMASAICFVMMYLYWPNASFVEAEDSTTFFGDMLDGTAGVHPNHLLFEPIYLWVMTAVGGASPLLVVQSLTALFALLGLLGVYRLIAPRKGWLQALLATWLVATTFGYWHYGKVVDAYVPALACAIWAMVVFDRLKTGAGPGRIILMALILSAAVLFHQLYIVLAFMICVGLLFGADRGLRNALLFTGVGVVVVGGAYVLAYLSLDPSLQDRGLLNWTLGRAEAGLWSPPDGSTPIKATMGIARVFVHMSAFFGLEPIVDAASRTIGTERLIEEIYLAQTAISAPLTFLLPVMVGLYGLALVILIPGGVPALVRTRLDRVDWLLVAAILVYTGLVLVWEASNNEFWIHIVAFVFILFAATLSLSKIRIGLAFVAIVCAAVVNFSAGILPLSDPRHDYWAHMRANIIKNVPEGSLILADCAWLCRKYLRMSNHRYYFLSSFDVHEQQNGIETPTLETPFYLTSWALAPIFGVKPSAQARRTANLDTLKTTFGPLPQSEPGDWRDPPKLWKWDQGWQPVTD